MVMTAGPSCHYPWPAPQLAAENVVGSLLGGALGLACIYLTLAAKGGSSANTITKVQRL